MEIRFAKKSDCKQIAELCREHSQYEKSEFPESFREELLFDSIFSRESILICLVVESNTTILGYATFTKQFSTWNTEFYLYLDCLFLKQEIRGKGIGKQMMLKIKEYAISEKFTMIQWQTPDFNENAIGFYRKLGAFSKPKERFFWNLRNEAHYKINLK